MFSDKVLFPSTGNQLIVLLLLICVLVFPTMSLAEGNVLFVSDGKGEIRFLWPPTLDFFPDKGWQIKRLSDGAVIKRWNPDKRRETVARIRPKYADSAEHYIKDIPKTTTKEERDMALGLISAAARSDFEMARALGFGCIITTTPGKNRYHLEMVDSQGTILKTIWKSPEIDTTKASKPVPPPDNISGASTEKGVALSWEATRKRHAFVTTFQLQRLGQDKKWQEISRNSLANALKNEGKEEKKPNFIDKKATLETENKYRLCAIDLFGRKSPFKTTSIFHADFQSLEPPSGLSAIGTTEQVKLDWKEHQNPFTAGYYIERKIVGSEVYSPITPKGVPRDTTTFIDKQVIGGVNYHYQIRSIDPRGNLGSPTISVAVTPQTTGPPPPPEDLVAEVNPVKVSLFWAPPEKTPILGYVLERKIADGGQWDRISPVHYALTRYEDYFPIDAVGTYHYRVISVGADSKKSSPSKEIAVELLGKLAVPPPFLREVTSKDETVTLHFNATGNKKLTDSFLVVRGNRPDDLGLVVGSPIDGSKTSFTDTKVRPGEDYWYGLVALDKEGKKSKISDKLLVRVIPRAIPKPEKPDCTYKQEPFQQVAINFEPPPHFLLAIILRKRNEQDRWTTIADNVRGSDEIIDLDLPPSGSISYAIMYKTEHGLTGEVSEERTVDIE